MAKDIPRVVVKRMVNDYQRGALFSPTNQSSPSRENVFWAYNTGASVIPAGTLVAITGFVTLSYDQAYQAMLNNQLAFSVATPTSSTVPTSLATTVDPISASSLSLGRIRYDGLTFILAHINNDSHTEISATGESVASDGACVIVAKSPKNASNYAVCAVAKKVGSGEDWSSEYTVSYATVLNNVEITLTPYDEPPGGSVITVVSDVDVLSGSLVFVLKYWKVSPKTVSHTTNVVKSIQRNSSGSGS